MSMRTRVSSHGVAPFSILTTAPRKENRGAFLALDSTIPRLGQMVGPLFIPAIVGLKRILDLGEKRVGMQIL